MCIAYCIMMIYLFVLYVCFDFNTTIAMHNLTSNDRNSSSNQHDHSMSPLPPMSTDLRTILVGVTHNKSRDLRNIENDYNV